MENVDTSVIKRAQSEVAQAHGLSLPGLKAVVEKKITNVTSKSFGIRREFVLNLIQIDDPVPKTISEPVVTLEDHQTHLLLRYMENKLPQREVALGDCTELGQTVLAFARPLPKDSPVEVTFQLGPDGLLKVHGRDLTTGKEIDAQFQTQSILSREEIEASKSRNRTKRVA